MLAANVPDGKKAKEEAEANWLPAGNGLDVGEDVVSIMLVRGFHKQSDNGWPG